MAENLNGNLKDYDNFQKYYFKRVSIENESFVNDGKRKRNLAIFAIILLILSPIIYFGGLTGKMIFLDKETFLPNETISGVFEVPIKTGELIPAEAILNLTIHGEENLFSRELSLKDILLGQENEGDLFYNGNSYGLGEGYGFIGNKTDYPDVDFKLKLNQLSVDGEISNEISGTTNYNEPFEYEFDGDVELISGSVSGRDIALPDDAVLLKIENGKIIVSTKYLIEREGFGSEFIGDEKVLNVDLAKFNISLSEGDYNLKIDLIYDNSILYSSTKTFRVAESSEMPSVPSEPVEQPAQPVEEQIPFMPEITENDTGVLNTTLAENETILIAPEEISFNKEELINKLRIFFKGKSHIILNQKPNLPAMGSGENGLEVQVMESESRDGLNINNLDIVDKKGDLTISKGTLDNGKELTIITNKV